MLILKDSKLKGITNQKYLLIIITSSSMEKLLDQPNDSDIKRYEEIRKLTTGKSEGYITGFLLDYNYIKNQ